MRFFVAQLNLRKFFLCKQRKQNALEEAQKEANDILTRAKEDASGLREKAERQMLEVEEHANTLQKKNQEVRKNYFPNTIIFMVDTTQTLYLTVNTGCLDGLGRS